MATLNVVCSFLSRPLCSPPPRHKCNVGLNVIWRNVHERTFFFPMVVRQNSRLKMHSAQCFDNCVSEIKICKNTNVHLWPLQARMVGMHPKGQCAVRFTLEFKRHGMRSKMQLLPYSKPRRRQYVLPTPVCLVFGFWDVLTSERSSEKMWHTIHYGNANGTHSHGIHELIKKATANLM